MHHDLPRGKVLSLRDVTAGDAVNGWSIVALPRNLRGFAACRCGCGAEHAVRVENLLRGLSRNCKGCSARRARTTHGDSDSGGKWHAERLYRIWKAMKWRCNPNNAATGRRYHGRGIAVCPEWLTDYLSFRDWALASGYEPHLSLDRVDNDGTYRPGNCRWATRTQQARNTGRTRLLSAFGEAKTVAEWAADSRCPVGARALAMRAWRGWGDEAALTAPPGSRR